MKRGQYSVGIDLGGTKVAFALVDARGRVQAIHRELSQKESPQILVRQIADGIEHILVDIKMAEVCGIGLASAGPMRVDQGLLLYPSNFPGWKKVPLVRLLNKELLRRKIRKPIAFQNDAMAAALGEGWVGAARGLRNYAVITLGTGIGTGVIFNGLPLQFAGMGSEWGIQLINSLYLQKEADPYFACVEGMASGTGILRRAQDQGFRGGTMEELSKLIASGDATYQGLFADAAIALAMLCYNLSLGLHLERILFSGGLMHLQKFFFQKACATYKNWIARHPQFAAKMLQAKLGDRAGVIGAAYLPRRF